MKKSILVFVFTLAMIPTMAQLSMEAWHGGMLVTADKDTLRGKIKYDLDNNIIQLERRGQITAYSAYKVFYFEFYDEVMRNFRRFYTLAFNIRADYQTPIIFELLYEGSLSLMAREKIVIETTGANPAFYGPMGRTVQPRVKHDFYFLNKKGKITFYSGHRKELSMIMSDKKNEIKNYIKSNRLKTDNIRDLIRITSFYNSI